MLLYVSKDHKDYQRQGAQDGLPTAPVRALPVAVSGASLL